MDGIYENIDDYNRNRKKKMLILHTTTINLKFQAQLGMMNFICLKDHILFQTFRITLNLLLKNTNLPMQIYQIKQKKQDRC